VQLLRTNGSKLHPLFFAIYGDIVYHHGAGFRGNALSRADLQRLKTQAAEQSAQPPARRLLRAGIQRASRGNQWKETTEYNNEQSRLIFEAIQANNSDWLAQVTDDVALEDDVAQEQSS